MAFPVIAASNITSDTDGTSTPVNMPAGIVAGNLLLIFAAHNNNNLLAAAPVGWTALDLQANGANVSLAIYGKIAVGGDTCTLSDANDDTAVLAIRVIGHNVVNVATDVVTGVTATGTSATPNPPNCNPAIARDYLWLEMFSSEDDDDAAVYWSTSYTGVAQVESAAGASTCMVAVAFRNLNAASENPGTMTMSGSNDWLANTLAIPPAIPAALVATISASAVVTAPLSTQITPAAVVGLSAVSAGSLTTQIDLVALADLSAISTGSLVTAIPMTCIIEVAAFLSGLATTDIVLVSTVFGSVALNADVFTQIALEAVLAGQLDVTADLTFSTTPVEGSSQGTIFVTGDLFTTITMNAISAHGFLVNGLLSDVVLPGGVYSEGLFEPRVVSEGISVA